MIDLDAIRRRCDAATDGPWTYDDRGDTGFDVLSSRDTCIASFMTERDAAFLTNAKTDIPALLAVVDGLAKALEKAEQFIANGVELGYIRMPDPDTPDSAHDTLPLIRAQLAALARKGDAT